jgi:hypothetical protein
VKVAKVSGDSTTKKKKERFSAMLQSKRICEVLGGFVKESRLQRFRETLDQRTQAVSLVLENLDCQHNVSAVLRTADGFGIHRVDLIENGFARGSFSINRDVRLGIVFCLCLNWLCKYFFLNMSNNSLHYFMDICELSFFPAKDANGILGFRGFRTLGAGWRKPRHWEERLSQQK